MSSAWVFVDDTDPSIQYSGNWVKLNITSAPQPALTTYGTLHTSYDGGSIKYAFTGTDIYAYFANNDVTTIASCLLDGQTQTVVQNLGAGTPAGIGCQNNHTLSDGPHELQVSILSAQYTTQTVLFDGIRYRPSSTGPMSTGVDIMYLQTSNSNFSTPNLTLSDPNHYFQNGTLDFDFFGYSVGFYCLFLGGSSTNPGNASYAVDGQAPTNFSFINQAGTLFLDNYVGLVVQTPRYELGQHHFHLDLQGSAVTTTFAPVEIIVQNSSTPYTNLVPIPAIPGSSSASAHHSESSSHIGAIIGGTIGGFFLLVAVSFIHRRRRRGKFECISSGLSFPHVEPFELLFEPFGHNPVLRDVDKRSNPGMNQGRPPPNLNLIQNNSNIDPIRREPRIIIHDDSGDTIRQPDEEIGTEVVELPPTYDTIRLGPSSPSPQAVRPLPSAIEHPTIMTARK